MKLSITDCLKEGRMLLLDGATWTQLQSIGLPSDSCPEMWSMTHPEHVASLATSYESAGSHAVLTNTFGANRSRLQHYGLQDKVQELCSAAVTLARSGLKKEESFVIGSMGPCGQLLGYTIEFDEAKDVYKEAAAALVEAGADALLIETFFGVVEARPAVEAAAEASGGTVPVFCTLVFTNTTRTYFGDFPTDVAHRLTDMGISALGANCGDGPPLCVPVLKELRKATTLPLIAKPNAGIPRIDQEGTFSYTASPEEMARYAREFRNIGAQMIGGCCGTSPAHISLISETLKG